MKLILLEDDSLIQLCIQDTLERAGFEVVPAVQGNEALNALSDSTDVTGMIVDVRVRGGLNGWEVARKAREQCPEIAIVYTTTADSAEYRRQAVDRSILLQKPYSLGLAVQAVRNAIAL